MIWLITFSANFSYWYEHICINQYNYIIETRICLYTCSKEKLCFYGCVFFMFTCTFLAICTTKLILSDIPREASSFYNNKRILILTLYKNIKIHKTFLIAWYPTIYCQILNSHAYMWPFQVNITLDSFLNRTKNQSENQKYWSSSLMSSNEILFLSMLWLWQI